MLRASDSAATVIMTTAKANAPLIHTAAWLTRPLAVSSSAWLFFSMLPDRPAIWVSSSVNTD